jgi:hypothetical protein
MRVVSVGDPTLRYDAKLIAQGYDAYGEREWKRFASRSDRP